MAYDLGPIRDEYPFEPKILDIGGLGLSYIDEGPRGAPAVVMLHGNPTWSFYYRRLILALRGRYRVIAPDHMGMGLSARPKDYDYTLTAHIANLERLLDHLSPGPFTLAMHDWGGAVGMGVAARRPEAIKSLVIFNTAAFFGKVPWRIRACRAPLFGALAVRGLNAFARSAITLRMATARPERFRGAVGAGYLLPYNSWRNRVGIMGFVRDIPLRPSDRSWSLVEAIRDSLDKFEDTPALLLWGMRDFCFTEEFLRQWLARLKNTEAHMFDDAGHYVVEDAGERIEPILERFLERVHGGG